MRTSRLAALAAGLVALCVAAPAAHAQLKLEWGVEGYYRTRAVSVSNLAHEPRFEGTHPFTGAPYVRPDITSTTYITQRLRLSPQLRLENIAKLNIEITALDDILYGDNNALNTAPLFSVNGTNQYFLGGPESGSVDVTRAWIEFAVPVGLMRVGRMPSHWGMGVLANGGGSGNWDLTSPPGEPRRKTQDYYFDDDFGDNHFGSTNDRILFATRPLTVLKTIQKKQNTDSKLLVAYAFDKLSEAPLLYLESDRLTRPYGQQGFISRGAIQDDSNEHVVVLAYVDPDWDKVRYTDELKIGTYWVFRTQDEGFTNPSAGPPHTRDSMGGCVTNDADMDPIDEADCVTKDEGSFVWVADFWGRIRYGFWYGEFELIHIGGETTGGVPFPSPNRRKKANINSGVLRGGYLTPRWDAVLELGYASGDDDLGDRNFKQRPMHPDFNVGLILFEEIVRERSARVFGSFITEASPDGAQGFFSNGGVVNAKYLAPKGRFRPGFGGFELVGQLLFAWVDKYDLVGPNVFVCPTGYVDGDSCTYSKYLGTEVDVAVKSRFARDLIDFSLEAGYLHFGDILKHYRSTGAENPNAPSGSFTIQARVAFVF
jgi:hypothetical protein